MRNILAAILCIAGPGIAAAQGFAIDDLRQLSVDTSAFPGSFTAEATSADRLTIACLDCEAFVAIDVRLGRQDDGTEGRVRSGETTIDDLAAICQARDATCQLEGVNVGQAIGWVTSFEGMRPASTTVLLRDGDLLMIRAIAADVATARRIGEITRSVLAPTIIGP
ncbi:hypothetical protein V8J82_03565 [Gymnodinialimonas sp. 2305UL16-5]|uniref:hypothetical protein n=1 Tax=Gymnodinialimonas mytili TaxID=3126503 RepID=UPI0030AA4AA2